MCKVELLLTVKIFIIYYKFINNNKQYGNSVFLTSGCFWH